MATTISGGDSASTLNAISSDDTTYFGLGGNDTINAGIGNDTLDGGTGNDDLRGGAGNDTYIIDGFGDKLLENANQGVDTLIIDAINNIAAGQVINILTLVNIENFDISRTGLQQLGIGGNSLNNVLTGNDADNEIQGYTGADSLVGGLGNDYLDGGAGIDTMIGGTGYDIYIVDNVADVVIDTEGLNEVRATVSYSIANNLAFDNLVLLGSAAINATGNDLNNLLLGNAGNNILDGGAGADDMEGGKGNDTYLWRDAGDTFYELANEGIDTLQLASDFGFAAGAAATVSLGSNIENLDASKIGGVAFNFIGNVGANVLTGNDADNDFDAKDGNDTMFGGAGNDGFLGGQGIDSLVGGIGDDIYTVNLKLSGLAGTATAVASLEDIIVETALITGGNDSILLAGSASLTKASTLVLAAGIENLYAYDTGTTLLNLTGNVIANDITGNDANNILLGLAGDDTLVGGAGDDILNGGIGADVLSGGDGNDTYVSELVLESLALGQSSPKILDTYVADSSGNDTIKFTGIVNSTAYATLDLSLLSGYENTDISATGITKLNLIGNDVANILTGNAANNSITGGLGNDTLIGGLGLDTLNGGYGDDTYFVNSLAEVSLIQEATGADTLNAAFTIAALRSDLEHLNLLTVTTDPLTLALNNINATGNAFANNITGNIGNNILNGMTGADAMNGDKGADTYIVDDAGDTVTEDFTLAQGGGIDTVKSSMSFTLGTNVDRLTLTDLDNINGTGNTLNNTITGNAGANNLNGDAGNDILAGGDGADTLDGGTGIDNMSGGKGDDIYIVDSTLDVLTEGATNALGGGIDTVQSSVTRTLGLNFDHLILTGADNINGIGNELANVLTGNDGNNSLIGGAGADTLNGGIGNDTLNGGAGIDNLAGGTGDDTYLTDLQVTGTLGAATVSMQDNLTEEGADVDTLKLTSLTIALANATTIKLADTTIGAPANTLIKDLSLFENIDISGTASTKLHLEGNDANNRLTGNAANNSITGGLGNDTLIGGLGLDTLIGGAGDDTYFVNSLAEINLTGEATLGGTDTLNVGFTHSLGEQFEHLNLLTVTTDPLNLALNNINATGNAANNILIGNVGKNILSGLDGDDALNGGLGADTLIGGDGNDTYTIDNALDKVIELDGAGTDTINSSVSYSLVDTDIAFGTLSSFVENLTLTGIAAINCTGNALNNTLNGNGAANILNGLAGDDALNGGAGNDVLIGDLGADALTGGLGADRFDFNLIAESAGASIDTIADFSRLQLDKIDLSTIDAKSGTALINDAFTFVGNNAAFNNVAGQLMFDSTTNSIYGDINGDSVADFQIILTGVTSLAVNDFIL